jgi:hypothetical protein
MASGDIHESTRLICVTHEVPVSRTVTVCPVSREPCGSQSGACAASSLSLAACIPRLHRNRLRDKKYLGSYGVIAAGRFTTRRTILNRVVR